MSIRAWLAYFAISEILLNEILDCIVRDNFSLRRLDSSMKPVLNRQYLSSWEDTAILDFIIYSMGLHDSCENPSGAP